MSSDLLHIKDGYYFDVPKVIWQSRKDEITDFPDWFVRLDPTFQEWESDKILSILDELGASVSHPELIAEWKAWQERDIEQHAGWPLDGYLEIQVAEIDERAAKWASKNPESANATDISAAYLAANPDEEFAWFYYLLEEGDNAEVWESSTNQLNSEALVDQFASKGPGWSSATFREYNSEFDGKALIPQPFATLRNFHDPESGFAVSRFMIIELLAAVLVFAIVKWFSGKVYDGSAPKGKSWNFVEGTLGFVRKDLVEPLMGEKDARPFMPFFWTLFLFLLVLNLAGMIPFLGAPTSAFGTNCSIALIVFGVGLTMGVRKFGVIGYLKNICPSLGLPWYLAIFVVPLLWAIEALSLLIKHVILAIRLLANMAAGHLILLGIMGLFIGAEATSMSYVQWSAGATVSLLANTLLSMLELFVAFLQAAIFTFLSAMFIGSSIHHH
jgi:F-type H+-transporting ATPase subunit a